MGNLTNVVKQECKLCLKKVAIRDANASTVYSHLMTSRCYSSQIWLCGQMTASRFTLTARNIWSFWLHYKTQDQQGCVFILCVIKNRRKLMKMACISE